MNFVSIILPFYKKEKYIEKTVKSILSQTFENFEILIIYDEVDYKNLENLRSLYSNELRIRIIVNNKNYGAGESRNIGIKEAKGSFIAFIDADDIWEKNKLEDQINFMLENNIDASHTSYDIIDANGSVISKRIAKTINYNDLLVSCDIGLSTVVIKKSFFNEKCKFANLKTKEDYVLWLRLTKSGIKFHGINKSYVKWRKLKNSLSSSTIRKLLDGYKVYNQYLGFNFIKSLIYLFRLSINYIKK